MWDPEENIIKCSSEGLCHNALYGMYYTDWQSRPLEDAQAARIAILETACRAALASIGETERLTWASDLYKQLTEAVGGEI